MIKNRRRLRNRAFTAFVLSIAASAVLQVLFANYWLALGLGCTAATLAPELVSKSTRDKRAIKAMHYVLVPVGVVALVLGIS